SCTTPSALLPPPPPPTPFPYTTLFRSQRGQEPGHAPAGAGIDERRAPPFDQQVGRAESRAHIARVDDDDTVLGRHGRLRLSVGRSEEHTSELQSRENLVCRLLLEKKKK